MNPTELIPKLQELVAFYGIKILAAVAIFILGRWVAKGLHKLIVRALVKSKIDDTLVSFLGHMTYIALLAFIIIAVLNQLGIQTTSFISFGKTPGFAGGLTEFDSSGNRSLTLA